MSTYELLAELPVEIDGYDAGASRDAPLQPSSCARRPSSICTARARRASARTSPTPPRIRRRCSAPARALPLAGSWTLAVLRRAPAVAGSVPAADASVRSFACIAIGRLTRPRWTWLCARPARTLHAALGRELRPVVFVASLRLGEPPSLDPLLRRLEIAPALRFKLDPTPSWDDVADRASSSRSDAVDSVDLKGQYEGTIVDNPADPALYGASSTRSRTPGSRTPS